MFYELLIVMLDRHIIEHLVRHYTSHTKLADTLGILLSTLSNWKQYGIPARWRPTIWVLLETRCPDVAATLDRDTFLGVHLTGDAA